MKPLNNYLLIEIELEKEQSAGGLYVPHGSNLNATNILKSGKVVEVSDKIAEEKIVNIGDIVLYNKHAITEVPNYDDKVLVRKEDLYMIL